MSETWAHPSDGFVLRTTALPFDDLVSLVGSDEPLRELERLWKRPAIHEAVFLASPSLFDAVERWMNDPEAEVPERAIASLVAYLARMAGRATPFGLFAGVTAGRVDDATHLELGPLESSRRRTRVDFEVLGGFVSAIAADKHRRRALRWETNTSLSEAGGTFRFAETRDEGGLRTYHAATAEPSPYLRAVLDAAATGAAWQTLRDALKAFDADADEADAFLDQLVDEQLLMPDLGAPITGDDPLATLIGELSEQPATSDLTDRFRSVYAALRAIDERRPSDPVAAYGEVRAELSHLPSSGEAAHLFQVDLIREGEPTLSPAVVQEIANGAELLLRLLPPPPEGPLARFLDAVVERYGEREVPLVEAVDDEIGVGFGLSEGDGRPLLPGLFPPPSGERKARTFGARDELLLDRLLRAERDGVLEIELTDADVEALSTPNRPPPPEAFEVIATIAARSSDDVDRGDFRVHVQSVDGPPGARLLGRFADADPAIRAIVDEHLRREESLRPDAVFAEIVHQPQGRLGNVVARPVLRSHEIVYLGRSGAPRDRRLPVSDLRLRVADGRPIVRSERLDREIVPRLTNAHFFGWEGNVTLYVALCALAQHGVVGEFGWTWGALETAPFLPRVTRGRQVLSRAQWNVRAEELDALLAAPPTDRRAGIDRWRRERRLPRWVVLADADNELPADLASDLSVDALLPRMRGRALAPLIELWPAPDELVVEGPDGRHVHQVVLPFTRARTSVGPAPHRAEGIVRRTFAPGGEWLFAKLYTGAATADSVLTDLVAPLVREALDEDLADGWFFLRYGDPEWHVRLRLHGNPDRLAARALPRLHERLEPWLADGRVTRLALDTYEREVERYGGAGAIELAEQAFRHDSDAVVGMLAEAEPQERWLAALSGIDALLQDAGLSIGERSDWVRRHRDAHVANVGADREQLRRIGARYRTERARVEAWMERGSWEVRSGQIRPLFDRIRREADRSLEEMLESFTHMHVNRALRDRHAHQELVLYDFLDRAYRSRLASRGKAPSTTP